MWGSGRVWGVCHVCLEHIYLHLIVHIPSIFSLVLIALIFTSFGGTTLQDRQHSQRQQTHVYTYIAFFCMA